MKENGKTTLISILFILVFIIGIFFGYRLPKTESGRNSQAGQDQSSVSVPSATSSATPPTTISVTESATDTSAAETVDSFNYLAIGNSITRHGITDFWWNNVGMAASDEDHDYYHLVLRHLEEEYGEVNGVIYTFSAWEAQDEDRDGTLSYLEPYLSPDLDLVTVQLGENISDLDTYQEDYISLLRFIRSKAPNARILVIEDFWTVDERYEMEFNACAMTDAEFVSLDGIANNKDYYCGLGTTVYDKDGNEYTVEHDGVAMHPGDEGMEAIAGRIIDTLDCLD